MRILGYGRVSQNRDDDKLSPDIQRTAFVEYCEKNSHELVGVIMDDNVKGGNFKRKGWQELMGRLGEVDGVLVLYLDRMGRNMEESLRYGRKIQEAGKEILSVHENIDLGDAGGQIHYKTLLYVAEIENILKSQKMKDVAEYKLKKHEWKGGPLPLGYAYDEDHNVVIDEREAEKVRNIFYLRQAGYTYNQIANTFVGIPGKLNGKITIHTVRLILSNPTYIGKRLHKGEVYDVDIPHIVSDDLWSDVQEAMRPKSPNGKHLLSGLLRCGKCGATLNRQKCYGKSEGEANWVCGESLRKGRCKGVRIREHLVEQIIDEMFGEKINGVWADWTVTQKKNAVKQFIDHIDINEVKDEDRVKVVWR